MLHCCCTRYIALQHSMPSMQHAQPPAEHVLEQLTCAHDDAKVVDGQPKPGPEMGTIRKVMTPTISRSRFTKAGPAVEF
jgi:hypothetical protein